MGTQGLGFRSLDIGFLTEDLGFRVQDSEVIGLSDLRFRV